MPYSSTDPATNTVLKTFPSLDAAGLAALLTRAQEAHKLWRSSDPEIRAQLATRLADLTRERKDELAALATLEMGKLKKEAVC